MAVHNVEISTENLLNAVVRMPEKDFERFFKSAKQIKERETKLINRLGDFDLSVEKKKVYRQLLKKFRAEKISSEEHRQLITLTDELENLNVERIKCLIEIAEFRNSTLDEVLKDLNIKPKNYG